MEKDVGIIHLTLIIHISGQAGGVNNKRPHKIWKRFVIVFKSTEQNERVVIFLCISCFSLILLLSKAKQTLVIVKQICHYAKSF